MVGKWTSQSVTLMAALWALLQAVLFALMLFCFFYCCLVSEFIKNVWKCFLYHFNWLWDVCLNSHWTCVFVFLFSFFLHELLSLSLLVQLQLPTWIPGHNRMSALTHQVRDSMWHFCPTSLGLNLAPLRCVSGERHIQYMWELPPVGQLHHC